MSRGWFLEHACVHERVPLNSQWLVLRIGGTNLLHCWVTDSIYICSRNVPSP